MEKSSAVANASILTKNFWDAFRSTIYRLRRFNGISTFAGSARFRMRGLEWVLSVPWLGFVGSITCGKRFPFPGCCIDFIHSGESFRFCLHFCASDHRNAGISSI